MTSRRLRVVVEADGGARGNPGPAGYGAVVREANTGEVLAERSASLGVATNNVAEYSGLIAGLTAAAELGAVEVDVRMDSKLVVEQMSGRWQIKNPGLRPLAAQVATLSRRFNAVSYKWIPREHNRHADALANAAMDAAASRPPKAAGSAGSAGVAADQGPAEAADARAATGGDTDTTAVGGWAPPAASAVATRLILVRHGETVLNGQGRYSGRGDVPLSERGGAQAEAAAGRVAGVVPRATAVVTSPLSRCTRTAALIAEALGGVPVVLEPDLIECDFGAWEGRTFAEVRQRWPEEMRRWLASTRVAPPEGESFVDVAARVRRSVAALRRAYPATAVVVVSHVSPIKIMLRDALAAGDAFLHRLYLDPAGVSIVDSYQDGNVAVRTVNDTAHLL